MENRILINQQYDSNLHKIQKTCANVIGRFDWTLLFWDPMGLLYSPANIQTNMDKKPGETSGKLTFNIYWGFSLCPHHQCIVNKWDPMSFLCCSSIPKIEE